jgi:hypothetical protein
LEGHETSCAQTEKVLYNWDELIPWFQVRTASSGPVSEHVDGFKSRGEGQSLVLHGWWTSEFWGFSPTKKSWKVLSGGETADWGAENIFLML